jgi:DNA-binding GntR family transcriptional regulator
VSLPNRGPIDDIDLILPTRETMTGSAAGVLRGLILSGKLPPGTPLRLNQLAARLGMSIMPVREALRALEAERLVTFRPHRGAVVADISPEDVEEAYEIRAALEGLAARDGVRRLTADDLARIRGYFAQMEEAAEAGDRDGLVACDQEFHRALFAAGRRPERTRRIIELWESTRRAVPLTYRAYDPLDVAIDAHRPILAAIESGDARAAERLSRRHTKQAATRVLRAIARGTARAAKSPSDRSPAKEAT